MSRRVADDFKRLNTFLDDYSLRVFRDNTKIVDECKAMHKKLYGLLIFVAEYKKQKLTGPIISKLFDELVSDFLLSLFCWIQGMYKPAKLELRCAIENFLKSVLSINTPSIVGVKSVYEIFDIAKLDKHFNNSYGTLRIKELRNDYSKLCSIVHSDPLKIHATSALELLPHYNENLSKETVDIFLRTIENCLGILFFNYPDILDSMHHENKKDFLDCLAPSTKKVITKTLYK